MSGTPFDSIRGAVQKTLNGNPAIVLQLSTLLKLSYHQVKNDEGNVCLIESEEVRPEFKEVFFSTDVSYYIIGLEIALDTEEHVENYLSTHFPYPLNSDQFWQTVRRGKYLAQHRNFN